MKASKAKSKSTSAKKKVEGLTTDRSIIKFKVCGPANLFGCVYTQRANEEKEDYQDVINWGVRSHNLKDFVFPYGGSSCYQRESHEHDVQRNSGREKTKEQMKSSSQPYWGWGCQPFMRVDSDSITKGDCSTLHIQVVLASKLYIEDRKKMNKSAYPKVVSAVVFSSIYTLRLSNRFYNRI